MEEKTSFLNMFSDYCPSERVQRLVSGAVVESADIDVQARRVQVVLNCHSYIPQRVLEEISKEICQIYGLRSLKIEPRFPSTELPSVEPEELIQLFVKENPITRGSLAGATWQWQENWLTVHLLANGVKELEKCAPYVKQQFFKRFSTPVEIRFEAGNALEGQALFDAMEKIRDDMIRQIPAVPLTQSQPKPVGDTTYFGKPFRGKITPMKQLDLNMGMVTVEGRVFAVDHKELPKRNAVVVKFDMTDNTGAVRINRFMENKDAKPILEQVKVGSIVRVNGKLTIDNFTNEMVLRPNAIMPGTMPKRLDTAANGKRVELHLHTAMSNMDALTSTKDAIKQAAAWGHKAIAITDHGCVQSFTDALHVVEDWKGPPKVAGTDDVIKIL